MFLDIGSLPPHLEKPLETATIAYLERAMPRGEYLGWVAVPSADPARIVAGAGVQRRQTMPFPLNWPDGTQMVGEGRQAIVMNVYTEPEWRRRGLARELMYAILAWAKSVRLEGLVLHGADAGRPVYESLGFTATNEMRYRGDLR
jgi:GNAT superfamily N-acetyltransferase